MARKVSETGDGEVISLEEVDSLLEEVAVAEEQLAALRERAIDSYWSHCERLREGGTTGDESLDFAFMDGWNFLYNEKCCEGYRDRYEKLCVVGDFLGGRVGELALLVQRKNRMFLGRIGEPGVVMKDVGDVSLIHFIPPIRPSIELEGDVMDY